MKNLICKGKKTYMQRKKPYLQRVGISEEGALHCPPCPTQIVAAHNPARLGEIH